MLLLSGRVIALGVCLANLAYGELTVEIKARIEERDSGHTMVLDVKNTGVRPVHLVYEDLPWNDFNGALALRAVVPRRHAGDDG